ncbi:hypothetical protein SBD_3559 [Streptomyces bottropensis ATCC 25435]|uniref:Uncharacterized protein n=1 Tax=Streptomyces bottropensis ATCC 25435 TaxID=1054862 RepID=M3FTH6_9ACTN|nr:hypothetical protein SBD_3559 [Streptomyces bottropensis ATCC 25435]
MTSPHRPCGWGPVGCAGPPLLGARGTAREAPTGPSAWGRRGAAPGGWEG